MRSLAVGAVLGLGGGNAMQDEAAICRLVQEPAAVDWGLLRFVELTRQQAMLHEQLPALHGAAARCGCLICTLV